MPGESLGLKTRYGQQLTSQGLEPDESTVTTVHYFGRECKQVKYVEEVGMVGRVARGALACFGAPALLFSSEFRRKTWRVAWNGREKETVLYDRSGLSPETAGKLGFDPTNRESVSAFMERNKDKLKGSNGHSWMIVESEGVSRMLFAPNSEYNHDFSKASSFILSNAKTGESLQGDQLKQAAYIFSSQYQEMSRGLEQKVGELMRRHPEKKEDEARKLIEQSIFIYIIDPKVNNTRVHMQPEDINDYKQFGQRFTGPVICSWSGNLIQRVNEYLEKESGKIFNDNTLSKNAPSSSPERTPVSPRDSQTDQRSDSGAGVFPPPPETRRAEVQRLLQEADEEIAKLGLNPPEWQSKPFDSNPIYDELDDGLGDG